MNLYYLAVFSGATFLAGLVQGLAAFGSAIVVMSLAPLFMPLNLVIHLVMFNSVIMAIALLLRNWRAIRFQHMVPLLVGSVIGIPVGVWGLAQLSEPLIKRLLGATILLYATYVLSGHQLQIKGSRAWGYAFGVVSGCLGGAFNCNGPPVVVYASLTKWPKDEIVTTLQGFFLISGLVIIGTRLMHGMLDLHIFLWWLLVIPAIVGGIWIGSLGYKRVNQ